MASTLERTIDATPAIRKEIIAGELTQTIAMMAVYSTMLKAYERTSESNLIEGMRNSLYEIRNAVQDLKTV